MINSSEYFREKNGNPSARKSNCKNMRSIAVQKLNKAKQCRVDQWMANSSVTLPNWNAARVQNALQQLAHSRLKINRTKLFYSCVSRLLNSVQVGKTIIQRTRTRNDKKYSYKKMSTYYTSYEWDYLHERSYHLKISFSQLLDIALRIYLKPVLARLLRVSGMPLSMNKKWRETREKLFSIGRYQKIILQEDGNYLRYLIIHDLSPPTSILH